MYNKNKRVSIASQEETIPQVSVGVPVESTTETSIPSFVQYGE